MPKDVYLDKVLRGWIVKTANKEYWRVPKWYSKEDLIQDGYVAYAKCWGAYRHVFDVPNPSPKQRKKFMALVKTTYYHHIINLSNRATETRPEASISQWAVEGETEIQTFDRAAAATLPDALTLCALARAPAELLEVLEKVLLDGVDSGKYLRKKLSRGRQTVRETSEEYWARVLGAPGLPERFAEFLNS